MKVEDWSISKVIPYRKNPKSHPPDQVEQIAMLLEEMGWQSNPIYVDKAGVIIAGHGRLLAAKLIKRKKVPVVVAKGLSNEQIRAYRIADNKSAESDWINDVLKSEMVDLANTGIDMQLTAFKIPEISDLLADTTGFLEDLTGGDSTTKQGGGGGAGNKTTFQLPFVFNQDDRNTVIRIVKEVLQQRQFETSAETLLFILKRYTETEDQSEIR